MKHIAYICCLSFLVLNQASGQSDCRLISFLSTVHGQSEVDQKNTYDADNRLVKTVKILTDSHANSKTETTIYTYNAKGLLTEKTELVDDVFRVKHNYKYNARGELISETESNKPDGSISLNQLLSLDNRTEKSFFESDGSVSGSEIRETNDKGDLVKFEIRNAEGQLYHLTENKFDDSGKQVYQLNDDVLGKMKEETFSTFGADGKKMADSVFLNQQLIGRKTYAYQNEQLVKMTKFGRKDILDYSISYSYDDLGRISEESFAYKGEILTVEKRQYDQNNNLIEEKTYNKDNQLIHQKNWAYACP
ncbi:hypothetical protein LAG90_12870 [Marinilongibacter aquaticus]|uniref:hypothetical protein n=1 Tax=Marinilongibacter aquaticus TaxID=2975157 RepID=UPI0021BDD229|nr:hypothetical protein [Marinilongibacter aquaticus]UBM57705.1 hypothetical protein LAG90_12870 [Marinilongibacter aquaticus]